MNAIELENVIQKREEFSLTIPAWTIPHGSVVGVIGPNGAGKTTLMDLLGGLSIPTQGTVRVLQQHAPPYAPEARTHIGYSGETIAYFSHLRLSDIRAFVAPFYPSWSDDKYNRLLHRFGLQDSRVYGQLSLGQKRLFDLALLLARNTQLLLLDEPTANLDPSMRQAVVESLFEEMSEAERTIIITSHITSDLEKIADYLCFVNEGRIVLFEEKDQLLDRHRLVHGKKEHLALSKEANWISVQEKAYGFTALTDDVNHIYACFGDEVQIERVTIEELYVFYMRRGADAV
ncbi:MAG: ATP-binding cassette domain-containing protein [Bacilli bacterium]